MAKNSQIQDFGEKLGGAKKYLWKSKGLQISDLKDMNEAESLKYIKKDNVWPKPDYQKLVDEGISKEVVYFYKVMRDACPTTPTSNNKENQENFIEFVGDLRDSVMNCKSENDLKNFYKDFMLGKGYVIPKSTYYVDISDKAKGIINNKLLKSSQVTDYTIKKFKEDVINKQFCYSENEKLLSPYDFLVFDSSKFSIEKNYRNEDMIAYKVDYGTKFYHPGPEEMKAWKSFKDGDVLTLKNYHLATSTPFSSIDEAKNMILAVEKIKEVSSSKEETKESNRKKKLIPKQLENIERKGPDTRTKENIEGQDFLDTFNIKGGEFGNWLNDKDRQASMNFAYDSFKDLATALNIRDEDIGLNNKLSIAFGSRGSGDALAHYEPLREVINLTKMKGAGALAHEYFHAMDNIFAKEKDLGVNAFITDTRKANKIFNSIDNLTNSLKYKEVVDNELAAEKANKNKERPQKIIDSHKNYIERTINSWLPNEKLNEEQLKIKQQFIDNIGNTGCSYDYRRQKYDISITDELSKISKETLGKVIPSGLRQEISKSYNACYRSLETIKEIDKNIEDIKKDSPKIKVKTDFYKNAEEIDNNYSKSGHGYWQSNVELAARAFECYIHDTLKDKGISNNYLTGMVLPDACYPQGEERKAINKAFDDLIKDFKELDLLQDRESYQKMNDIYKTTPLNDITSNINNYSTLEVNALNKIINKELTPDIQKHSKSKDKDIER